MPYMLPPAGNRISLAGGAYTERDIEKLFAPYNLRLFHSGTAALAAAVMAAARRKPSSAPEVLLPAYACPDLISAIVYVGAKPVLVDLAANTPWFDQQQLAEKITERTAAIIGVNFLGIAERMPGLREIADRTGIILIEDSAQCLLEADADPTPRGDFIILSFGRGKPVSLLGGGAVLYRDKSLGSDLPDIARSPARDPFARLAAQLKVLLYNALLAPQVYGLLDKLPFLHIGETRFEPLADILPASAHVLSGLPVNIRLYRQGEGKAREWIRTMLDRLSLPEIVDMTRLAEGVRPPRLLRYPLLVTDSHLRERLYQKMRGAGLGVSKMYPSTLPGIPGLAGILDSRAHYPQAEALARGIITLPTHQGVNTRHVAEMQKILALYSVVPGSE